MKNVKEWVYKIAVAVIIIGLLTGVGLMAYKKAHGMWLRAMVPSRVPVMAMDVGEDRCKQNSGVRYIRRTSLHHYVIACNNDAYFLNVAIYSAEEYAQLKLEGKPVCERDSKDPLCPKFMILADGVRVHGQSYRREGRDWYVED